MTSSRTIRISVIAAAMIIGGLGLAAVGGGALFVSRDVHVTFVDPGTAGEVFARARARFAGQPPIVELRGNDEPVVHHSAAKTPHEVDALHVLAYDPAKHKLIRADLPGWILRLITIGGRLRLAGDSFWSNRARLTLGDLERHGPGLVIDAHIGSGTRLMAWTE